MALLNRNAASARVDGRQEEPIAKEGSRLGFVSPERARLAKSGGCSALALPHRGVRVARKRTSLSLGSPRHVVACCFSEQVQCLACMFLQCCSTLSLVSGYSLHFRVFIAALRQAYKTTRAPSSPPLLFVSSSSRLLLFCSSPLLLVSSSARLLRLPRRSLTAPPLFVFYTSAREVERGSPPCRVKRR
jgi:hypothetical protein